MKLFMLSVVIAVTLVPSTKTLGFQCPPSTLCPPPDCGTIPSGLPVCNVTCLSELLSALANKAAQTGCAQIVIPAGETVDVCSSISIGSAHDNLHLTINGELRFVGTPDGTQKMLNISGASDLTIDGTGLITSVYTPCQEEDDDAPAAAA